MLFSKFRQADGDKSWTTVRALAEAYESSDKKRFSEAREGFERSRRVQIVEEYYSGDGRTGVVLTQPVGLWCRLKRSRHTIKLHYDASRGDPRIGELVRTVLGEERTWCVRLGWNSQKVLVQIAYTLIVYVLSFLRDSDESIPDVVVKSARKESEKIKTRACEAAGKDSLKWYLFGLPFGAAAVYFVAQWVHRYPISIGLMSSNFELALCMAFGAIGAIVSVMSRITRGQGQGLDVDNEQSFFMTVLAGGFRPIVGAALGAALYVLIRGGIVPLVGSANVPDSSFYYAGLAFLAGFSERWAQDTIVRSVPREARTGVDRRRDGN